MPGGALLYLETPHFAHLLRDWDTSKVKADWLGARIMRRFRALTFCEAFGRLQRSTAKRRGSWPAWKGSAKLLETDSRAGAIRNSRRRVSVHQPHPGRGRDEDQDCGRCATSSPSARPRRAVLPSHRRSSPKRTVAFALTKGYLLLATRDDLLAKSLELLAGGENPSIASDRWYRESVAAAQKSWRVAAVHESRIAAQEHSLPSYWVQRNARCSVIIGLGAAT